MRPLAESASLGDSAITVSPPAGALGAAVDSYRDDVAMNRSERVGFWLYVAMGIFCMAVLVAAAMTAIAS